MKSTMMAVPLSTNTMFARMDKLFGQSEVISRLPDKRLVRHSFTEIAARTRALANALKELGIKKAIASPRSAGTTMCISNATSAFRSPER